MAVWMPETVVPRSLATDLIDTFITDVSRVIRNWPEARMRITTELAGRIPPSVPEPTSLGTLRAAPVADRPSGEALGGRAIAGTYPLREGRAPSGRTATEARQALSARSAPAQTSRRSVAHLVSSWRVDSCNLRKTDETWDSTVLTEMVRSLATSL